MYFMYVDESGDCGLNNSPTKYFVLTGLVIHELRWKQCLESLLDFRRRVKAAHGIPVRDELRSSKLITRPGSKLGQIKRNDRLAIMRAFADEVAALPDLNIINIVISKSGKPPDYDVFEMAWKALIQRFENTLSYRNFRGPTNPDERGILFPDHTDDKKLRALLRKMRRYNPVPHHPLHASIHGGGYRNLHVGNIVEDPNFRDSAHSYFIQAADLAAYLLHQSIAPNAYMKKKSGQNYFQRLEPALCKVASRSDPMGIVWL